MFIKLFKRYVVLGIALLFTASCGGSAALPVQTVHQGDSFKSCKGIEWELGELKKDMQEISGSQGTSAGANLALLILSGPLSLDPGVAQNNEMKAFIQRYNHLLKLGSTKGCVTDKKPLTINESTSMPEGDNY